MQTQQPYPLELRKYTMILWIHMIILLHHCDFCSLATRLQSHETLEVPLAAAFDNICILEADAFWARPGRQWKAFKAEMTICKKSSTLCTKSIKSTKSTHHFPKVKLCLLISGLFRSCVFMLEASTFPKMVHPQRRPPAVVTSSFALLCCAPENPGNAWTTPGAHQMPEAL